MIAGTVALKHGRHAPNDASLLLEPIQTPGGEAGRLQQMFGSKNRRGFWTPMTKI